MVRLTLHLIVFASKGLGFTHENGKYGSVSVTARSCIALILKVNPHILGGFLCHSLTQCDEGVQCEGYKTVRYSVDKALRCVDDISVRRSLKRLVAVLAPLPASPHKRT